MRQQSVLADSARWLGLGLGSIVIGLGTAHAQFSDVTTPPLDVPPESVAHSWIDVDGDGDLDILAGAFAGTTELLRNDGADSFAAVTPALFGVGSLGAGIWADYDVDGDIDVLLATSGAGRLLRNDGDFAFVDVAAGDLLTLPGVRDGSWVDFDQDNDYDLWMSSIGAGGQLLRNDGGDSFVDVTPAVLSTPSSFGEAWGDYDNDGDMDVVLAPGSLIRNDGGGAFSDVTPVDLVGVGGNAADAGDFDNDGDLDVYVGTFASANKLFRNDGGNVFADVTEMPLDEPGFNAVWQDFDNDGDLDLYATGQAAADRLLRNDGGTFANVADSLLAGTGPGAGAAWADYDDDGDPDLYVGDLGGGAPNRLLRNDDASGNHWLRVETIGTQAGIVPFGARVTVVAGGLTQTRELSGSNGFGGHNSFAFEFGLGTATVATSVRVRWPDGTERVETNVPVNRVVWFNESEFTPTQTAFTPGVPFDLTFDVAASGAPLTDLTLFAREAGAGTPFTPFGLVLNGAQATTGIPSALATPNGIEYFVEFRLNGGSRTVFSPGPGPVEPEFLPAQLGNSVTPEVPAAKDFALFGFPFRATNASVAASLEDELGPSDKTKWRFGRFNPGAGAYDEHPDQPLSLNTGQGFWLTMKDPVAVGSTGFSSNTVGGFPITLPPGWSMIAAPYLFTVALGEIDFSIAPNVQARLVGFVAGLGYSDQPGLEPFKGYWMRNNGSSPETIVIPGVVSPIPRGPAPAAPSFDWRIRVAASQGSRADRENVAAVAPSSAVHPDELDLHEPPGLPGYVRTFFETADASGAVHELTRDVRPDDPRGQSWDLVVSSEGEEPVHLAFEDLDSIPAGLGAVLIPEITFATIDLRERDSLVLTGGETHRFRLAIGTDEFIETVRAGQDRLPVEFALGLAYPNPASGATSLGFALPRDSQVELGIYNVAGRLVRTLVSETLPAGRHTVTWNADDGARSRVAPGVYFARLHAGEFAATRKLILVK